MQRKLNACTRRKSRNIYKYTKPTVTPKKSNVFISWSWNINDEPISNSVCCKLWNNLMVTIENHEQYNFLIGTTKKTERKRLKPTVWTGTARVVISYMRLMLWKWLIVDAKSAQTRIELRDWAHSDYTHTVCVMCGACHCPCQILRSR